MCESGSGLNTGGWVPVTETRGGENPGDWVVAYDENGVFTLEKGEEKTE